MRIKGKWLPGNNKSELRKEDHKEFLKVMGLLDNKKLICRSEGCEKEAAAIIDRFTFCADCGLVYLKAKG